MWSAIVSGLIQFLANLTGILKRKGDSNNQPDMRDRAKAQQEQAAKDAINSASDKAMHGKTQAERDAALAEARRQDSE